MRETSFVSQGIIMHLRATAKDLIRARRAKTFDSGREMEALPKSMMTPRKVKCFRVVDCMRHALIANPRVSTGGFELGSNACEPGTLPLRYSREDKAPPILGLGYSGL